MFHMNIWTFEAVLCLCTQKIFFQLPSNVHRNCVAFQKNDEESFTIIDSVKHIELHIQSDNYQELCLDVRSETVNGIEECAKNLHYDKIKKADLKLKFVCGNEQRVQRIHDSYYIQYGIYNQSTLQSPWGNGSHRKTYCMVQNKFFSQCMGYMKHKRNDI